MVRTVDDIDRDIRAKSRELAQAEAKRQYGLANDLAADIDGLLDERTLAVADLDNCTR